MKAYEVLEKYGWCKRSSATDSDGNIVHPCDPKAIVFSGYGAIVKAYGDDSVAAWKIRILASHIVGRDVFDKDRLAAWLIVMDWNDDPNRKFEEVVATLRELDI